MQLLLISPTKGPFKAINAKQWSLRLPPLGLAMVASLTSSDFEVSIIDEKIEEIDFDRDVDLVGITSMTATAPRAYEIADRFRQKGVSVVLGGIHPSSVPQEAIKHADAVVIGEAEDTWERLITDFRNGEMQKFYKSSRPTLNNIPLPRRELFKAGKYLLTNTIQTTRGCPFDCNFCTVTQFFGNTFRFRPIQDVVNEIKRLHARFVGFVDDNIIGNIRQAKKFFRTLIPLKIKWMSQASIMLAQDDELLKLAKQSGCIQLFIGFESLISRNLKEIGKRINVVEKFKDAIKRIHDHGIGIEGAFIFGLDHDDESIFEKTVDFAQKAKLDSAQFGILTPFPGTRLYEKLDREGRIFDRDWSKYDIEHVVFRPKLMSPETLERGFRWAYREFYSLRSIFYRTLGLNKRWRHFFPILGINLAYNRTFGKYK